MGVLALAVALVPAWARGEARTTASGAASAAPLSLEERRLAEALAANATGGPEAVAGLAALVALIPDLGAARIEPALLAIEQRGAAGKADPLVVAHAGYHLGLLAAARGDDAGAAARFAALGLFDRFAVVGPFDAAGRGAVAQPLPPELPDGGPPVDAAAPARSFPGKEREVRWRASSGAMASGALALDGLLRPDKDATAYVLTYVRSPRARTAVLRLGSPGPLKAWVAGRPVFSSDVIREPRFDQDAVTVQLPAGETAILIKTVVLEGAWRVFARLTDEAGRPLTRESGVTLAATGTAALVNNVKATAPKLRPARELGELLRARAQQPGLPPAERARRYLDHARWLSFSRQADREAKADEAALEAAAAAEAPPAVATEALLLLGARAQQDDDRRRAYERAVALAVDPSRKALALLGLGELARARRRDSDAIAKFRAAAALDPDNVDLQLALAGEDESAGLPASSLVRIQAVAARRRAAGAVVPDRVVLAEARVNDLLGRRGEAERLRKSLWPQRQTDLELALALARAARERDDLPAAIAYNQAVARQRPDVTFVETERARLLEGQGDFAGAQKVLQALAVRLPDEASVWEELGRLAVRAGQLKEGAPSLRKALALRPQNPALRRYVARLEAELQGDAEETGDDLVRAFAEDGEALARPALAGRMPPQPGAGGTDVLLEKQVVRVHRNGLSERFVQRLILLRTEQAAREALEQGIRYTPGSQEVEVRRARIYRKGADSAAGKDLDVDIIEAAGRDDRDLSEPWYGLYYDVRAEVVLFEGLRAGDVIELSYTLSDVSFENVLRDYFGDLELIGESAPRRRWEYVLLGPAERRFYFNQPSLPGLSRTDEKRGDEQMIRFAAKDVPAVIGEPGMPGWTEVIPYVHVSTFADWAEMGRWYWGLIADQLAADEPLRKAGQAAIAAANARTVLEKTRALHALVLESTRYVGLEFGIHGFKPYKVSQVFQRRFGDCKDKASLLHVLLREAGIDSEIVLLRTRRSGKVAPFPASLAVFDHAIVHVPALGLYLDGTAEFSGMKELPAEDQGVTVLLVSKAGVKLTETPVLPPIDNHVLRRWTVRLDDKGGGRIEEEITVNGQAAPEWREHYETPGERMERFARVWDGRFPGATLERVELDGVEERNRPVVARSVAVVPELLEEVKAGVWRLPIAAREPDLVRSYARLSARRHDFVLGYPFVHEERLRFELPAGLRVAALPAQATVTLTSRFGRFALAVTAGEGGRVVEVNARTEISEPRVAPAEYGAFRAFLGQLDAALRQSVMVQTAAEPAPAPTPPKEPAPSTPAPAQSSVKGGA